MFWTLLCNSETRVQDSPTNNKKVGRAKAYGIPNNLHLICDGARAETRFRLSAKRTSPLNQRRRRGHLW